MNIITKKENEGTDITFGDNTNIAVGDDSRIDNDAATKETDISNVGTNVAVGDDRHVDDADESIFSDYGTEDDQVSVMVVPQKRPSRPMEPGPDVVKVSKRKSLSLFDSDTVFISIVPTRTIEMIM
jgi:hypothetical protein